MRDTDTRFRFLDHALDLLWKGAAALRVDVGAVGLVVRDRDFSAELTQNAWR